MVASSGSPSSTPVYWTSGSPGFLLLSLPDSGVRGLLWAVSKVFLSRYECSSVGSTCSAIVTGKKIGKLRFLVAVWSYCSLPMRFKMTATQKERAGVEAWLEERRTREKIDFEESPGQEVFLMTGNRRLLVQYRLQAVRNGVSRVLEEQNRGRISTSKLGSLFLFNAPRPISRITITRAWMCDRKEDSFILRSRSYNHCNKMAMDRMKLISSGGEYEGFGVMRELK